jgi:hypothetical protein
MTMILVSDYSYVKLFIYSHIFNSEGNWLESNGPVTTNHNIFAAKIEESRVMFPFKSVFVPGTK